MYTLTLTHDERQAIDWIGHRYAHGDKFARLLLDCEWIEVSGSGSWLRKNDTLEWDFTGSIMFEIPENLAWQMRDMFEEEDFQFDCLSEDFAHKLMSFCFNIV